jgi:hypothetical protein
MMVVRNSTVAKSRIVNMSVPRGPHATIAQFQAPSEIRRSDVTQALQLALDTCVGIAEHPAPIVAAKAAGREATDYEIIFFVVERWREEDARNGFYDAAHRHLEALRSLTTPMEQGAGTTAPTLEQRLVEGISVFGFLCEADRAKLAGALIRRELTPGEVVCEAGQVPQAITIVAYGIPSRHQRSWTARKRTSCDSGHANIWAKADPLRVCP